MRTIYKRYKERLIEISGRNRSLFLRSIIKKYSYDMGAILEYASDNEEFLEFLWQKKRTYSLINEKLIKKIVKQKLKTAETAESEDKMLKRQTDSLKYLKREVEELEKETGRYELFIGYPFVFGTIGKDNIQIKAPLLLFPVTIDINRDNAVLSLVPNQPIMLNKSLVVAYAKENNLNTDNLVQEFDLHNEDALTNPYDVIDYLNKNGFKIRYTKRKGYLPFDEIKEVKTEGLEAKNMAVLGRFPLANSIYNDYLILERENLSTPSIDMLIKGKTTVKRKKKRRFFKVVESEDGSQVYTVNDLDYTQENAIDEINKQDNLVIYGPPGTGKSQTIVNIISDALCKNKRVLVVSQKRAALDVVYSRLGKLNSKAMLIPDPEKDKMAFFERIKLMHAQCLNNDITYNQKKYQYNESNINKEIQTLQDISDMLFTKREFGLSYQEMYARSHNIGKDTKDYKFYTALLETDIINRNYSELSEDIQVIKDKNFTRLFVDQIALIKKNPMVAHIKTDIDMHKIRETRDFLEKLIEANPAPFDTTRYPYCRYVTTFYLEEAAEDRKSLKSVADIITRIEHPTLSKWLSLSTFPLFWPLYPAFKLKYSAISNDINIDLNITKHALEDYSSQYAMLSNALDREGYALAIGGLINGNIDMLRKLREALDNYVTIRDMNKALNSLKPEIKEILTFAYENSEQDLYTFNSAVENVLPVRIYHEIVKNDEEIESVLSKTVLYESLRERILNLKADQRELSKALAMDRFSQEYVRYFRESEDAKDYLYQVNKQRALWPIRRMLEYFNEYLFRLFPCWLLSPDAVSTIFPLKRDMFDLIVFDEASQIFIEAALPTIYRGSKIVVAGDNKQLRPTSGFVRRFLGDDSFDYNMTLSTQAALEVESLLDLATAKYHGVNLSYHYRSASAELIDFSNIAFYENKLQIAPNVMRNPEKPPIERIKVKGMWTNRKNPEEAAAVVKLVKSIFKERQFNESIGIVTFNIEQKEYIEDMLDAEADKTPLFRKQLFAERNRIIDGENASLFVKNLENVQGDERDIIIFSIGYAKNDFDKVVAQFGSLSMEGGENRLNVAITRAKKKIYVVTSIDPEELDRAETTKNAGPKLLRKYLQYIRAVSEAKPDEVKMLLSTFDSRVKEAATVGSYEGQIKEELEKLGYSVDVNLGNTNYKLSLGIYDKDLGRYLLGVECDYQAYKSSDNILERDIYRIKFLESRGWRILRVWSRDWWQSRKKVLERLTSAIEEERTKILKQIADQ